jgi:RNA recognition motif. (a.k.a. RRM, RBD, or RNP domain)
LGSENISFRQEPKWKVWICGGFLVVWLDGSSRKEGISKLKQYIKKYLINNFWVLFSLVFQGIQIKSRKNNTLEIKFLKDHSGKKTGEAFVYFENPEETKKALEKNRERIGKRWVCGLWGQLEL